MTDFEQFRRVWPVLVALSLPLAPRASHAEDASRVATATLLFDEAVQLMQAGRFGEACPKLAHSHELAPSGGTLLALGECYEHIGKTASAWLALREAAGRAAAAGKIEAQADAESHAARLAGRLPRLMITAPSDVEVRRDGVLLTRAELGVATPLDPGTYHLHAGAPNKLPWTETVTLTDGAAVRVTVPALMEEASPTATPASVADGSHGRSQRVLGIVLAGAGVAAMTVGGVLGIVAANTDDEALGHCRMVDERALCTQRGLDLTDRARGQALASTILFVAGGLGIAGGGLFFFTAPSVTRTSVAATATLRF